MTVVDSSVLAAIVFGEADAAALASELLAQSSVTLAAPALVEATMVIEGRQGAPGLALLRELIEQAGIEVVAFDAAHAARAVAAWRRFGKGRHPAALNLGDCFSYALAKTSGEPLLFKGDDFAQTDIATP